MNQILGSWSDASSMPFIVFGGVAIGIVYITRQSQTKTHLNQNSIVKKEEEN